MRTEIAQRLTMTELLIIFTIKYGPKFVNLLDKKEIDHKNVEWFIQYLMESPSKNEFLNVLASIEGVGNFKVVLYGHMIISNEVSEENYLEYLKSNIHLALAASNFALTNCLGKNPIEVFGIQSIGRFLGSLSNPEASRLITDIKFILKTISASVNVTYADLGINAVEMDLPSRVSYLMFGLFFGRIALAWETAATFSDPEKFSLLKSSFVLALKLKNLGLKAASRFYRMLPEVVCRPVQETQEYLKAVVHHLRLDRFDILPEGEHKFIITLRATPEQVAAGFLEEMTYYARRDDALSFNMIADFCFDIKFTSAEAFEAFISLDFRGKFPEIAGNILNISKDTLNLILPSRRLKDLIYERGYKIMMRESDFVEFLNEKSISNITNMELLIPDSLLAFPTLSKIKDPELLEKLERFTNKSIVDIFKIALNSLNIAEINQFEYFQIRNALHYWMKGPERDKLNEIPVDLKRMLVREFPTMIDFLTLS